MEGTAVAPEFGTWSAPDGSLRIEYSTVVMEQVRAAAVEGFHRVPHGGVETGGILFGAHEMGVVRITAWRPIACEYARGPSFVLSEKDEAALVHALEASSDDPHLAALEPVGWYHAHTRSEIFLSDQDLRIFSAFFPQPWDIALVLRPASFAPTRAGFFFREPDGSIRAESSYLEFTLTAAQAPRAVPDVPPPIRESHHAPVAREDRPEPVRVPVEPHSVPVLTEVPVAAPRPKPRWIWMVSALAVAVAVALVLVIPRFRSAPPQHLALTASDTGGQLHIAWDRNAQPILNAARGSLEIDDHGVRTEVKLTPVDLRSGSVSYARQSGDVHVKLTVQESSGAPVEEVTRFLRPDEAAAAPAPAKPAVDPQALSVAQRIEQQKAELSQLEQTPAPAGAGAPPIAAPVVARPKFRPPVAPASRPAAVITPEAPPNITSVPVPQTAGALPLSTAVPSAPPIAPPRSSVAPASSGRIIWTGRLAKDGALMIQGSSASAGTLSGALPAVPARVVAYPADLTGGGMAIYTTDTRYSQPRVEAPGERNGWNQTTYTYDSKRAAGVRIVEQPSAQNGYRLVLHGETPKLTMVFIEWHAQ